MFRLIFMLKRIIWKVIWHFVYFFLCRPKLLVTMLVVAVAFGVWFSTKNETYESSYMQDHLTQQSKALDHLPPLIHKPKLSNSRFSKDVATELDAESQAYYAQQYQYAMLNVKDGLPYFWVAHDTFFGKITPYKIFTTKRGNRCRKFSEMLHAPHAAHIRDGIGCERANGSGWCRLPAKAIPNCEIGFAPDSGIFNKIKKIF